MNTEAKRTLHPMILSACVAVLIFSAIGIAAIMGWIPGSAARNTDAAAEAPVAQAEVKKDMQRPNPVKQSQATPVPVRIADNSKPVCSSCGVVETMRMIQTNGEGSGVGAVGGALMGGLLGNQVGDGNGQKAMTVVGAVGGGFAGNHIEKRLRSTTTYEIVVRMDNGSSQVINESAQPTWRNGDRVKIVDGLIRAT